MNTRRKNIPAAKRKTTRKHTVKEAAKPKEVRKLAAIMFTDMVGYSALTQKDESLALRVLEEHRAIIRSLIAKHDSKEILQTPRNLRGTRLRRRRSSTI